MALLRLDSFNTAVEYANFYKPQSSTLIIHSAEKQAKQHYEGLWGPVDYIFSMIEM